MIRGEKYYFFRLDRGFDDPNPEFFVAKSLDDLRLRLGDFYMGQFQFVCQLNEVTLGHIRAIEEFLNSIFFNMPRIHTDLHFIPADNIDRALSLLRDAGLITRSERDVRLCNLNAVKRQYPDHGAFVEVKSLY